MDIRAGGRDERSWKLRRRRKCKRERTPGIKILGEKCGVEKENMENSSLLKTGTGWTHY